MGCHFLLQGIFPSQGLNLRLLLWQEDFFFLPLSHLGTPDLLNQKLWGCGPAFCVEPSPSGDSDTR